jgi:hypothetical protein
VAPRATSASQRPRPDPVEVRLHGGGQLRVRIRVTDQRESVVVIERVLSERARYSVTHALELPAHQCEELGATLLRFAQAIPSL